MGDRYKGQPLAGILLFTDGNATDIRAAPELTGMPPVYPVVIGDPNRVKDVVQALKGTNIPVASVATGFPAGQTPLPQRIAEIEQAIEAGAAEIDVVINRTLVLTGDWQNLYDEVRRFRETCCDATHMQTILATGDLATLKQVYQASLVAMMAGSDFIKTSTGKESVNATLEFGLVMARAIREYYSRTGTKVGLKPAGGISKATSKPSPGRR